MYTKHSSRSTISPVLPPTALHRPSLVAALNEAVEGSANLADGRSALYKLILLCAPAGYGKTTLLTDFAERTPIPCCWYFLDHTANDAITFLAQLLTSIRSRFPQFGVELDFWLTSAMPADTERSVMLQRFEELIDALILSISAEISERFAIILCNYHEVNQSKVINSLVNRLIKHLPPQCVVMLESRAIPALEFVPLLARREMFGMGSNELRFTVQEIRDLAQLQKSAPLTDAEATSLAQSFDGWIAGILLGTHLGDLQSSHLSTSFKSMWGSPAMKMDREHLFAYLVNEVFTHEVDAFDFLREASVLQQMTPSLCAALLDVPDANSRLSYLEQRGLFVTHYDVGSEKYYHCHPVLRELLYNKLRTHTPERFTELHLRAVELFRGTQDDEAIFHALAAQAWDVAANLIEKISGQCFAQGCCVTLAQWIDRLPTEAMRCHPGLLLTRASIFLAMGESRHVQPLLDRALAIVKQDADNEPTLLAEILIVHGAVLFQQGNYAGTRDVCQQALTTLPIDAVALRARAHQYLGACAGLLGSFTDCIAELQQALQLCGRNTQTRQVANLHSRLANAYGLVGHHALSEHHRTRAVHCWEMLNDEWGKIDNLIGLGVTKQRQGAFAEAEQELTKALVASRGMIGYKRGEAYALISLGDLYQDQNRYQDALIAFEDGLAIARQQRETYLIHYTICALATTYLFLGDSQTALLLIIQTNQDMSVPGYGSALRTLTLGTILLKQQRYREAQDSLTAAEISLQAAGLKREQLQAKIRTAACLLAQGETSTALRYVKEALAQAEQNSYEELIQIELSRAPDLLEKLRSQSSPLNRQTSLDEEITHSDAPEVSDLTLPSLDVGAQSLSTLRIQALGEPSVFIKHIAVTRWRMARTVELFFLLLNAGRPMHKEQIIVALWPNADEQIDQTWRSTLFYLRKVLGTACVVSRGGSYTLDLTATYGKSVWYDVTNFQEQYAIAKEALTMENDLRASKAFQEMIHLYQGDYVQSFYSDWCIARRDELRRAYVDAHHQLALIAWRSQQLDKCIHHWQHLLTMDSCLEEAHYGLMRCYLQQKKRGLALRQYQRCVASLHEELGATPGQRIQRLYQRLIEASS